MVSIYGVLFNLLEVVRYCREFVDDQASKKPTEISPFPRVFVPFPQRDMLSRLLPGAEQICKNYEIKPALDRIERLKAALANPAVEYAEVSRHYHTLYENIEDDLRERSFWYFSSPKEILAAKYGDIPFKEGPELEQARYEWRQALWAYRFELNTASVFHLMRLSELGLRALGTKLNITLKRAIEFEDWRPILEAVDAKLKALENEPRTPERARDLSFYSDAGKTLLYFKNLWRDGGAHAREIYGENDAKKALDNVFDFMKLLAEKLDQLS
jgi:hypothetical protein